MLVGTKTFLLHWLSLSLHALRLCILPHPSLIAKVVPFCSQNNVMNASRNLHSVAMINQPKNDKTVTDKIRCRYIIPWISCPFYSIHFRFYITQKNFTTLSGRLSNWQQYNKGYHFHSLSSLPWNNFGLYKKYPVGQQRSKNAGKSTKISVSVIIKLRNKKAMVPATSVVDLKENILISLMYCTCLMAWYLKILVYNWPGLRCSLRAISLKATNRLMKSTINK